MKQLLALSALLLVACVTEPETARTWSHDVGVGHAHSLAWSRGTWTFGDSAHTVTVQVKTGALDSTQRAEFDRLKVAVFETKTDFAISGPSPLAVMAYGSTVGIPVDFVSETCDNNLDCTIQKEITK
jgi:hypothetical protein